ncbi:MAG: tetratricopeptide repeat protein [Candidatus Kapaibacteriota bacterium]|jgi:hypothetical protein
MNSFTANTFTLNSETEDLLVQYLDGTLSASDQARFETLLRENPAFADEVRAITSFDEMIDNAHLGERWIDRVDTAFLGEMQQQMAQTLALGTATAIAASAATTSTVAASASTAAKAGAALGTGKIATLLTGTFIAKSIVVAAVCGGIGYGAWKYAPSSNENPTSLTSVPSAPPTTTSRSVSPEAAIQQPSTQNPSAQSGVVERSTDAAKQTTKAQTADNIAAKPESTTTPTQDAASITNEQDSKASADIESKAAQDLRNKIDQMAAQVRMKEQSGDKVGFAFDAKKLAMLERTAGKFGESAEFFEKALKAAQNLKLRELEGEIRAELALLYREQGSAEKALTTLREAVKILTDEGSSKAAKWTKELDRWEKR